MLKQMKHLEVLVMMDLSADYLAGDHSMHIFRQVLLAAWLKIEMLRIVGV